MREEEDSSSNESSSGLSTASSSVQINGSGCSSILSKIRSRGRHRICLDRALKIRTCSYPRTNGRIVSRQRDESRSSSGLGQLLSPDRKVCPFVVDQAPVQEENKVIYVDDPRKKASESLQQVKKSGGLSTTIAEIFRCFICLGKLVDAQLCPCCSKLVCMPCIQRWLTDQKSECPHCRAPLFVSQLVSCKFISEITTEVEKIHGNIDEDVPPEKVCAKHGSPLSYFCSTCSIAVCSDCAILAEDHQNHIFERLSVTYGKHTKKLNHEASALHSRLKDLYMTVASVDKDIEAVLKAKDDQANDIEMAFKRMRAKLEEQLKCKLLMLLSQKGAVSQEIELLETILKQLDYQLSTSSKSDLIAHEPTITRVIQDLHRKINMDIRRDPVSAEFISEVVPPFEHGELVIENFKKFQERSQDNNDSSETTDSANDVVYSAPISATGVTWRLKVYPNGSGTSKGNHISAFLEMVKGGSEPTTYEYGIEMLHPTQSQRKVTRRFSSDFEEGACWGYYQFYNIKDVEKDGYLSSGEDTIALTFYVRTQTFLQQCLDLRRALSACQLERDEAVTQVAVLRRAFASSMWQHRRSTGSSLSNREDDQGSIKHVLTGAASSLRSFEQSTSLTAMDVLNRLDKIIIGNLRHKDTETQKLEMVMENHSVTPSIAVSRDSSLHHPQYEGREKCEHWLRSRDNLFQIPAKRHMHKLMRSRKTYKSSNKQCSISEGNETR